MCTLTVIPHAGGAGYRLVTNRDEQRTRVPAAPPGVVELPNTRACWPVDPAGGGTWVGVSDAGLTLAVLNVNASPAPPAPAADTVMSRGAVIPALMGHGDAARAARALPALPLERYRPFRLVAADRDGVWSVCWNGRDVREEQIGRRPVCFVSSGLGDHLVAPRLALFEAWVESGRLEGGGQDEFHRHRWPDRPEISVDMSRPDARTVSRTAVEAHWGSTRRIVMTYDAGVGEPVRVTLPLRAGADAGAKGREPSRC